MQNSTSSLTLLKMKLSLCKIQVVTHLINSEYHLPATFCVSSTAICKIITTRACPSPLIILPFKTFHEWKSDGQKRWSSSAILMLCFECKCRNALWGKLPHVKEADLLFCDWLVFNGSRNFKLQCSTFVDIAVRVGSNTWSFFLRSRSESSEIQQDNVFKET